MYSSIHMYVPIRRIIMNFTEGQTVVIIGTEELPTKWTGSLGTILTVNYLKRHEGFYKVLIHNAGETGIFHESQLKAQ